jgi:hypothetical protein
VPPAAGPPVVVITATVHCIFACNGVFASLIEYEYILEMGQNDASPALPERILKISSGTEVRGNEKILRWNKLPGGFLYICEA